MYHSLGHAEEAQLPYFDLIPSDPTLEEVRKLVCIDRRRPSLPNPWNQHEVLAACETRLMLFFQTQKCIVSGS